MQGKTALHNIGITVYRKRQAGLAKKGVLKTS